MGKQLSEFSNAHGGAAITSLTSDSSGRRCISVYISYISAGIIAGACSKEHRYRVLCYMRLGWMDEDTGSQRALSACSKGRKAVC